MVRTRSRSDLRAMPAIIEEPEHSFLLSGRGRDLAGARMHRKLIGTDEHKEAQL